MILTLALWIGAIVAVFALVLMVAFMRAANEDIFPTPKLTQFRPDLRDDVLAIDQHRAESRERLRRMQATFARPAAKGFGHRGPGAAA